MSTWFQFQFVKEYLPRDWLPCFKQLKNKTENNETMVFSHWTTGSTELWFLKEEKQMRWAQQLCHLTAVWSSPGLSVENELKPCDSLAEWGGRDQSSRKLRWLQLAGQSCTEWGAVQKTIKRWRVSLNLWLYSIAHMWSETPVGLRKEPKTN